MIKITASAPMPVEPLPTPEGNDFFLSVHEIMWGINQVRNIKSDNGQNLGPYKLRIQTATSSKSNTRMRAVDSSRTSRNKLRHLPP